MRLLLLLATAMMVSTGLAEAGPVGREPGRPQAVRTIVGEAVVLSQRGSLVIAVDEAGQEGSPDESVDNVLHMVIVDLYDHPFTLQDAAAEIEVRRFSLRALLPTLGLDLRFRIADTNEVMPEPDHLGIPLEAREFALGLQLYQHQDARLRELTLQEVRCAGTGVVKVVREFLVAGSDALGITPLKPPQEPDSDGSSCKATCSITCGTGTCAASCVSPTCARCYCVGETPPTQAACTCN